MRWEQGIAEPNDYNRYKIERLLSGSGIHAPHPAYTASSRSPHAKNGLK
jgi:hypothetical protein